jgi:hypothetical protein
MAPVSRLSNHQRRNRRVTTIRHPPAAPVAPALPTHLGTANRKSPGDAGLSEHEPVWWGALNPLGAPQRIQYRASVTHRPQVRSSSRSPPDIASSQNASISSAGIPARKGLHHMIDDTKVVAGRVERDADVGVLGGHSKGVHPAPRGALVGSANTAFRGAAGCVLRTLVFPAIHRSGSPLATAPAHHREIGAKPRAPKR